MITYYCPRCWAEFRTEKSICPECGYVLEEFQTLSFEDKLLTALKHVVPERRIMAAQILGNMNSQRAVEEFEHIVESEENNYYILRAVLQAVAKIDHPKRESILNRAAQHPSLLVSELAKQLVKDLSNQESFDQWDRHTG